MGLVKYLENQSWRGDSNPSKRATTGHQRTKNQIRSDFDYPVSARYIVSFGHRVSKAMRLGNGAGGKGRDGVVIPNPLSPSNDEHASPGQWSRSRGTQVHAKGVCSQRLPARAPRYLTHGSLEHSAGVTWASPPTIWKSFPGHPTCCAQPSVGARCSSAAPLFRHC
jgi:hypothetical protein